MEFVEAKQELIDKYAEMGFSIPEETDSNFYISIHGEKILIPKKEIEDYKVFTESKLDFQQTPVDCSICSTKYREHVITNVEPNRLRPWGRIFESECIFGEKSDEDVYVTIGECSITFINFFRFHPDLLKMSRVISRGRKKITMMDYLRKPLTIKVFNLNDNTIQKAVNKSSKIIEDCLFELSYLKHYSFWLSDNWPNRTYLGAVFSVEPQYKETTFPLSVHYIPDLIRLYQYAQSTVVPEAKFLAYYQIMEYFFVSVSDEKLYEKLRSRMQDPRFNLSNRNLESISNDVRLHRRESDETKMLQYVLEKFIIKKDLISFINSYEDHLTKKIYSNTHDLFGKSIKIELKEEHILSMLSVHIKAVRNAIVHSSDRYEGNVRHIPFSKTTKLIALDIPLMKYLAERIILASATPSSIYKYKLTIP